MDPNDVNSAIWPIQLTKEVRRGMYPTLEPSQPELSAEGKIVLITGVSGGIGSSIAEAWAIAGAAGIVVTGRNIDKLEEVAAKIKSSAKPSTKILVQSSELTSEDSIKDLYSKAKSEIGTIDVLINNAGTMKLGLTGEVDPSTWWTDFESNVKGTYLMSYYFLRQAKDRKGTIISLSSGAAGTTVPTMSSYNTSKLAQTRLMEFIHAVLKQLPEHPEIRTFTILPGLVKTSMTADAFKPFAIDDALTVGGMSLFLCTSRAEWLRGCVVSVNWDIEELEAHAEEIQREGRNKTTYLNARLGKGGHPWEA